MDGDGVFLVQNKGQGYLGNSPFFWAIGGNGYTAQIDKAERFNDHESRKLVDHDPNKWKRWRLESVMQCLVTQCDIQPLSRFEE